MDEVVDERALREVYLRPFEIAVQEGKPWTVMAAYNRLNGTYCCENKELLDLLRREWGFDGLVMSDWGAVNDVQRAMDAGMDLEMPASPTATGKCWRPEGYRPLTGARRRFCSCWAGRNRVCSVPMHAILPPITRWQRPSPPLQRCC